MKLINRNGLECPCCQNTTNKIHSIECVQCGTEVHGNFEENEFTSLGEEDLHFLRVFINCEGKLKNMEKALGISYPSVKNKLSKLKEILSIKAKRIELSTPKEVLEAMDRGEIKYDDGVELLKAMQKS